MKCEFNLNEIKERFKRGITQGKPLLVEKEVAWLIEQTESTEELKLKNEWLLMLKERESEDKEKLFQSLLFLESLSRKQLENLVSHHEGNPTLKEMLCDEADK